MINLNIPSNVSSKLLHSELESLGLHVTHFNAELHVIGTEEQVASAVAFVSTFDFQAGVMADVVARFNKLVQAHLDAEAKLAGYDDMISACSYAGFANAFQLEGQSFLVWRAEVWTYIEAQYEEVKLGNRTIPAVADVVSELPTRVV